jgi:hypothetical protein
MEGVLVAHDIECCPQLMCVTGAKVHVPLKVRMGMVLHQRIEIGFAKAPQRQPVALDG